MALKETSEWFQLWSPYSRAALVIRSLPVSVDQGRDVMSIIDAMNRWYAAWNAHDTAAVADAMSPAGTYTDPTLDLPIDNQTTAQYAVSNVFETYPDAHFEILTLGAMSDTTGAAQWRMTGTHKSNGRPVATKGADFFNYDLVTDRLSTVVGYFDVLSAQKQISG